MPRTLPTLLLLCALAILCAGRTADDCASAPEEGGAPAGSAMACGELIREGNLLRYERGGEPRWERAAQDAVPYKIVSAGSLPLVVSLDGLRPQTWAAAALPRVYPDMLPLQVAPPLYALSELSPQAIYTLPHTLLLDSEGAVLLDAPQSELLLPYSCEAAGGCTGQVYVAGQSADADALYPYGSLPYLSSYSLPAGELLWLLPLPASMPVADVELLAQTDERLLLLLLYDYELAELLLYDAKSIALISSTLLYGQLASNLVYPGPGEEPAQLELSDAELSLLVILSSGGHHLWRINLADGSLTEEPAEQPSTRLREENNNPTGGSAAPGPGNAPFPQRLLPEQSGEHWRTPALCDSAGCVFVIDSTGGHWIE